MNIYFKMLSLSMSKNPIRRFGQVSVYVKKSYRRFGQVTIAFVSITKAIVTWPKRLGFFNMDRDNILKYIFNP